MWSIIIWILLFIGSYLVIYFAADIFIDNLKDLCLIYKLSPFVIGLLVLGIDPEESIASIVAAINGLPFIAVGNVIGNSILSFTLCFVLPALFYKINLKAISGFYFMILYACMVIILVSFFFEFGLFTFGFIALILYIIYIIKSLRTVSKKRSVDVVELNEILEKIEEIKGRDVEATQKFKKLILVCLGLLLIFLGGELLIFSTEQIITLTHISEEFFGFIIIAFVTNVEELTLVFKSIKKKSVEIGLGGMIGKIIWNLSFTFGISSIIAISLEFKSVLIFNWLVLLGLIIFYQIKANRKSLGRIDAGVLTVFLLIFIIVNILPL